MIYEFRPRDKVTGALITNLNPVFSRFVRLPGNTTITPQPVITEYDGIYRFTYIPTEDVAVEIDLGESANVSIRYIDLALSLEDAILSNITSDINTLMTNVDLLIDRVPSLVASDVNIQTILTRITNNRATLLDNLSNLTAVPANVTNVSSAKDEILGAITNTGVGDCSVDHNYPTTDAMRYMTSAGVGIDNATILIYLKSDYNSGNSGDMFVLGRSSTKTDGRWKSPIKLDTDLQYIIEFYKQGIFQPTIIEITT